MAYNYGLLWLIYGLLWLIYGLLWGIVAYYFKLLGFPGRVQIRRTHTPKDPQFMETAL